MTSKKLFTLEQMVVEELERNPRTRDNDRELTLKLHTDYYGVNPYAPYVEVMHNDRLPTQESIGRCRRKVQERRHDLRGSKAKEAIRMAEQKEYIAYARGEA